MHLRTFHYLLSNGQVAVFLPPNFAPKGHKSGDRYVNDFDTWMWLPNASATVRHLGLTPAHELAEVVHRHSSYPAV